MNMVPIEQIDEKRAFVSLPPLIKGYLRLGGFVGDGAVVDPQFGTVDVSVVVVHDLITDKYVKHYREHSAGKTDQSQLRRLIHPCPWPRPAALPRKSPTIRRFRHRASRRSDRAISAFSGSASTAWSRWR